MREVFAEKYKLANIECSCALAKSLRVNFCEPLHRAACTNSSVHSNCKSTHNAFLALSKLAVMHRQSDFQTSLEQSDGAQNVSFIVSPLDDNNIFCRLALNFRATESEGSKDNALHKTDYKAFLQFVEAGKQDYEEPLLAAQKPIIVYTLGINSSRAPKMVILQINTICMHPQKRCQRWSKQIREPSCHSLAEF